jgi:hypothetical protein
MNRHFPIRFHGNRNRGVADYGDGDGDTENYAPRWFRRHRKHHHCG